MIPNLNLSLILPKNFLTKLSIKILISLILFLILGTVLLIFLNSLMTKTAISSLKSRLIGVSFLRILYRENILGCNKMSSLNSLRNSFRIKSRLFAIRILFFPFILFKPASKIVPSPLKLLLFSTNGQMMIQRISIF